MKIRKGERSVKVPPIGQLIDVRFSFMESIDDKEMPNEYMIWMITPQEMEKRLADAEEIQGIPVYATMLGNQLMIHPPAATDGQIRIRYWPPMREA